MDDWKASDTLPTIRVNYPCCFSIARASSRLLPLWCLLLFVSNFSVNVHADKIRICTEAWEGYSAKDGTGIYHELWNKIYKANGVKVEVSYHSYSICEDKLFLKGDHDFDAFVGGSAKDDSSNTTIDPKMAIGFDIISVIFMKGTPVSEPFNYKVDLLNKAVGWRRGYALGEYAVLNFPMDTEEVVSIRTALQKLRIGTMEFFLDYEPDLKEALSTLSSRDKYDTRYGAIKGDANYLVFKNNETGKRLADIWDVEMKKLKDSGELKAMFQKFGDASFND